MSKQVHQRQLALATYEATKEATIETWRKLFDKESAGSYYRRYHANMAFSLNDYPRPFDYTIIEFSSQPTLEVTNGEIAIRI